MKKIVLFIFDLGLGGTEKVMVNLANYLNRNDFKVHILTISDIRTDLLNEINEGVEIESLRASRILFSYTRLLRYIKNNDLNYFVANVWPLTSLTIMCGFFIRNFHKKVFLIDHCHLGMEFASKSYFFRFFQKISIRFLYPFSQKVVAVSQGVKDDLVVDKMLSANMVTVIENPVNCEYVSQENDNEEIKKWSRYENFKFISVGNFKPQKNYSYLVEVLKVLKFRKFPFKHIIVGDGTEMKKIEREIIANDLSNDLILVGSIAQPLDLIEQADLFVLPSSFEGFGLVIVEALSVGTTVVSTDCFSGPSDILKNGELGYLSDIDNAENFADTIIHACSNKLNSDMLKLRAKDFTIEKIGPKYIELLRS